MYHDQLKKRTKEKGFTFAEIAEEIGISPSSLTHRIQYTIPWRLTDVYIICDMLDIPYREIYNYFPPLKRSLRRDLMGGLEQNSDYKKFADKMVEHFIKHYQQSPNQS